MSRKALLAALAIVAVVQLAWPLSMIARRERVLRDGELFRFRTAPVDPVDVFRGRFVALGVEEREAPTIPGAELTFRQRVYARLETGPDGFARVAGLSLEPPAGPYLAVRVLRVLEDRVHLMLPFGRYYLPEHLAPRAEAAYARYAGTGERDAWIEVRVLAGLGVIEELYLGGRAVREVLAEE